MRYLGLFLLLFITSNAIAQIIKDKEPAIIEIHYMKTEVADTLEDQSYTGPMTLRIGKTSAMFYPTKMMWADSLLQTDYALYEKLHRENAYKAVGLYTKNLQPVGVRLYVRNKPYTLKSRQEYLQKMYKEYILGDFSFKMSALHGNGSQKNSFKGAI